MRETPNVAPRIRRLPRMLFAGLGPEFPKVWAILSRSTYGNARPVCSLRDTGHAVLA